MMKDKILITSPTGKTGYPTVLNLLNDGYPVRIYNRSKNAKTLELEKAGAEIALGNLDNYMDLSIALKGVKRVYYCYPMRRGLVEDIALFIRAARENKIEAVVIMGQWLAQFDDQKSFHTNEIRHAYELLEKSGLNVVYFIPGFFADNFNFVVENVVQFGMMPMPLGGGDNPAPSTEDMALVLFHLLKNPTPYIGKRLRPTGPKILSPQDMADIFSKVVGKKVKMVSLPEKMMIKALFAGAEEFSITPFMVAQTRHYFHENKKGKFAIGGVTNVVKDVTGKDPDNFETITRRWIEASPYKKRNFKNWINAAKKVMAIPFTNAMSIQQLEELNQ